MSDQTPHRIKSPDGSSTPEGARIRELLEEILETGKQPHEVSGGDIEIERVLRERLHRLRGVDAQMEAMFPAHAAGWNPARRSLVDSLYDVHRLPEIPGYEVLNVIGTGGMGVVYRARHLRLNRLVAIKMVLLGAYASREDTECLLREAQSVAALRHPNIVQVFDVAEHDAFPYYAMELLEGGDLAKTIQGKPRAAREAAELVQVLAGAVHAAHLAGIVHRDLKPGNIFLDFDETPKIGDFSLSRKVDRDSQVLTNVPRAGTPSYMAPEQAAGNGNAIDPAVDIYSLGAVLYELLTGRPPFAAESSAETLQQVIGEEPVPPSRLNSRVPRDLQTICLKCLQKDPVRRYPSAADLAGDLERFVRGEPIHARPVGVAERTVKWCRRQPAMTLAIIVCVIALTGAIAGGLWIQQAEHARRTQEIVRRDSARRYIESSLPLLSQLVTSRRWSDAGGVLRTARTRLEDAQSRDLDVRLAAAAEELEIAEELDRIRQSFPESDKAGYTFLPASDAYAEVFRRVGIGSDVGVETAALRIRESPLREDLLIALDHAAFTERFNVDDSGLKRLLAVGRTAAPNPWQDRFRDPSAWRDIPRLKRLVKEASSAEPALPSYQIVMVGLLLSSLGDNQTTIEILREAQLREPSDFWVNLELGHALKRDRRNSDAVQFYRAAVALKPKHYVAWTEIGRALLASGNAEDAIPPLRKAIALRPEYPTSWQTLIVTLAACGRWEEAVSTGRDAVSANPATEMPAGVAAMLHLCQARSAAVKGSWAIAADSYAKAVDGNAANDSHALFEFAAIQVLAGNTSGYHAVCASMRERCESDGIRRFLVARACTLATISDEELRRATELGMPELDRYSENNWSLTERGALLCRKGQYREAIPILNQSLLSYSRQEECIVSWAWLSLAHLNLGEHDAARMWLDRATPFLDRSATKPQAIHLHDWLEAQILRRELETILAD